MIAFVLLLGLAVQGTSGFTGTWERDPDRSDDAQAKMRAAVQQMQEQMERRGGGVGGGPPPGGPPPGGRPGGGSRIGEVPEELQIEHDQGELRLDDGERLTIYYLDGQKHRRALPNGAKLETIAVAQGRSIVIEEKLDRGKIDRTLELSSDGETLVMTWTIEMKQMKEPVVIRTVYGRIE